MSHRGIIVPEGLVGDGGERSTERSSYRHRVPVGLRGWGRG